MQGAGSCTSASWARSKAKHDDFDCAAQGQRFGRCRDCQAFGAAIKGSITLADLLRRPGFHATDLVRHGLVDGALPRDVLEAAEIDVKYSGYLARQSQQIERVQQQGQRAIPPNTDFSVIRTLSREARERLNAAQPLNLGQASRLPGVSPADITALLLWLELQERSRESQPLASSGVDR